MKFDELFQKRVTEHYRYLAGDDYRAKETVPDRVFSVMGRMVDYSEEMRLAIYDYLGEEASYRSGHVLAAIHSGQPHSTVRQYMAFEHALRREDGQPFMDPMVFLASIKNYQQLPYLEDYSEADEKIQAQVVALLTVVSRLHECETVHPREKNLPVLYRDEWSYRDDRSITLKGNDLIRLVIENPREAKRIAGIIIERETDDVELISSILHSESPAIANGAL